jgi:hypothetical protein
MIKITEQTGAVWVARKTGADGDRALWVALVSGLSSAKPSVIGFYASSIGAASEALSHR